MSGLDTRLADAIPCDDCSREVEVWFAPNPLWNLVIGGPAATDDPGGMLCPSCFIQRAEKAGIKPTAWVVQPEGYDGTPTLGEVLRQQVEEARAEGYAEGAEDTDQIWLGVQAEARAQAYAAALADAQAAIKALPDVRPAEVADIAFPSAKWTAAVLAALARLAKADA